MSSAIRCVSTRLAVESWAGASYAEIHPLLHSECTRWSIDLGWDLARDWAAVEPGRRAGLVSGWLARDAAGRIRAWAFGVDQPEVRQVATVLSDDPAAADALLSAICADESREVMAFVRTDEVVTVDRWRAHGFQLQPYAYLVAPTQRGTTSLTPWSFDDREATAALFAEAYAADTHLRPFARRGTHDEWIDYLDALTMRPGCGVFSPEASRAIRMHGDLAAVALVTSIGATTAHLAQIAVAPAFRRRGLSRQLLGDVMIAAETVLRASRLSLLVSEANPTALGLYERFGFRATGEFLAARNGGK